jgi:hypothetical protein
MSKTKDRKRSLVIMDHPSPSLKAKRGAEAGSVLLTSRWLQRASRGQRVSWRAVRTTVAPSWVVVLVQGIRNETDSHPDVCFRNERLGEVRAGSGTQIQDIRGRPEDMSGGRKSGLRKNCGLAQAVATKEGGGGYCPHSSMERGREVEGSLGEG